MAFFNQIVSHAVQGTGGVFRGIQSARCHVFCAEQDAGSQRKVFLPGLTDLISMSVIGDSVQFLYWLYPNILPVAFIILVPAKGDGLIGGAVLRYSEYNVPFIRYIIAGIIQIPDHLQHLQIRIPYLGDLRTGSGQAHGGRSGHTDRLTRSVVHFRRAVLMLLDFIHVVIQFLVGIRQRRICAGDRVLHYIRHTRNAVFVVQYGGAVCAINRLLCTLIPGIP